MSLPNGTIGPDNNPLVFSPFVQKNIEGSSFPSETGFLLLENGSYLLLEDGGKIKLENS